MSPEIAAIVMFAITIALIMVGNHVAWAMGGVAVIFGLVYLGGAAFYQAALSVYAIMISYPFVAIALFILMGTLLQHAGVADRLFEALHLLMGSLNCGLAIATMIIAAIFGACTGIAGASVVTIGLLALPAMLKVRYQHGLIAGSICAGGGLGVIIPPSIVIIIYGPNAGVSIATLFTASIMPGILLTVMYIIYILVRCRLNPQLGPPLPLEEREAVSTKQLVIRVAVNLLPPVFLILAVLGSIMFGIAAPTEAASLGAVGSLLLCIGYGKLDWKGFKLAILESTRITAMVVFICVGAKIFTNVFLSMDGGKIIQNLFLDLELSSTWILIGMLGLNFLLGMVFDWIGLIFILVPLYTPIIKSLGFNPIWFGTLFCIVLQISYMTPPFAYSIFYFRGIAPPEVKLSEMYKGAIPFVIIQVIAVALLIWIPQISLWLPSIVE
jgi:tripartite ATP-independent transporter DctM subunit